MPSKEKAAAQKEQLHSSFDMLIHYAYEDFKFLLVDFACHQSKYLHTYLWLSTLLIAFNFKCYIDITNNNSGLSNLFPINEPNLEYYTFSLLSLISLLLTFILGVDTLRSKGDIFRPFGDYKTLIKWAQEDIYCNKEKLRPSILISIQEEINIQERLCDAIGKRLKFMSYMIILSVILTISALITLFVPCQFSRIILLLISLNILLSFLCGLIININNSTTT